MHIGRKFTSEGQDPYELVAFRQASSEIRNPDGSVVFAADGIEVPADWSEEQIVTQARHDTKVSEWFQDKPLRKVIYVEKKLVNFVV